MKQAYLFVHFRERTTPDGEQVYFGLSKDGFHWESVNNADPVLWAYYGDKGVRDFTITRCKNGKFYIVATDLCLAYGLRNQYKGSWANIGRYGSKHLSIWESDDLVNWKEQRLAKVADENFGCVWAPDIIYDEKEGNYVLHWSSSHSCDDYKEKAIYYCRTEDFEHFTEPQLLYRKEDSGCIDSAMYEEDGVYYMFVKSEANPEGLILLKSENVTGPFERVAAFDESMAVLTEGNYEAPTAVKLEDGRWCMFTDYFGVPGAGQGYVPFVSENLAEGRFERADMDFAFPYGFKHGTILTITEEEYERVKNHDWSDKGWTQELMTSIVKKYEE